MFRIFIGYDTREAMAYHVLSSSILLRASGPVSITPLIRSSLTWCHKRPRGPLDSTDFSITRFLVPFLSGYTGVSLFMDSDMLCLTDIYEVWSFVGQGLKAVHVCQHDYTPKSETKFLGEKQTKYRRKNWSSFMLFNNSECRALTPEYVNNAPGLDLHRFAWLKDHQIASLPLEWNHLVGEYPENPNAKVLHWTLGGPWFPETKDCPHAGLWLQELNQAFWPGLVGDTAKT